jgi:hypothetical protein
MESHLSNCTDTCGSRPQKSLSAAPILGKSWLLPKMSKQGRGADQAPRAPRGPPTAAAREAREQNRAVKKKRADTQGFNRLFPSREEDDRSAQTEAAPDDGHNIVLTRPLQSRTQGVLWASETGFRHFLSISGSSRATV